MDKCSWPIGNGNNLMFDINTHNAPWNKVAGLYIFARKTDNTHWKAIYVGQCEDFTARIPNHESWNLARQHGATHVHALTVPSAAERDTLETRLIANLQPVLNKQKKAGYRQTG